MIVGFIGTALVYGLLRRNSWAPLHCRPQDVRYAPLNPLEISPRETKGPADLDDPFVRDRYKAEGISIRSDAVNRAISTSAYLPTLTEARQVNNELGESTFKIVCLFGFDDDQE